MAGKTVSINTYSELLQNLSYANLETAAKWLSCNGEVWGVGPTAVFASAAALFLFSELEATMFTVGDQHVSRLEKTMVSTMVLGMLALMIHLWVCFMRFFQYYLDTLIRDSPNVLLEMTTAGLLGGHEVIALAPITKFLKLQQPLIHITVCWFLALCYADYVRKNYCRNFNMPYLEQWQAELHARVSRRARCAVERAQSLVGSVQRRLRGLARPSAEQHTVRAYLRKRLRRSAEPAALYGRSDAEAPQARAAGRGPSLMSSVSSAGPATPMPTGSRNSEAIYRRPDVIAEVQRTPASTVLSLPPGNQRLEAFLATTDFKRFFTKVLRWN